jgi:(S)-2-hydroxyglutarate dehydrogenase
MTKATQPISLSQGLPSGADVVVVGAGVVGLSVARALKLRQPELAIVILEKESAVAKHASGRNSGVLHSGVYYPPGTIRAKVCRRGVDLLSEYCEEKGVPFNRCGKVIVPVKEDDNPQLEMLLERGHGNGVDVEMIDAQQLKELEPCAHTITGKALWVHTTGTYDQKGVMKQLVEDLSQMGVQLVLDAKVSDIQPERKTLTMNGKTLKYELLVNAAGLQADHIAKAYSIGKDYTVLPFKGLYFEVDPSSGIQINRHIYPVPDMNMPFLGVHFTISTYGKTYLGPTAVPAFGRENYRGWQGVDLFETPGIFLNLARLYWENPQGFRNFTHEEAFRYFKPVFIKAAKALVPSLQSHHVLPSEKVGIRPQFLNVKTGTLVMDFLVETAPGAVHILNAISPAFTSAFAFAEFVLDNYIQPLPTTRSVTSEPEEVSDKTLTEPV